jgi:hypothetical protein
VASADDDVLVVDLGGGDAADDSLVVNDAGLSAAEKRLVIDDLEGTLQAPVTASTSPAAIASSRARWSTSF